MVWKHSNILKRYWIQHISLILLLLLATSFITSSSQLPRIFSNLNSLIHIQQYILHTYIAIFYCFISRKKIRTAVYQYVSRKSCCVGPWVKGFHSKESAGKLFAGRRGGSRLLLHSTLGQCNYTVVQSGGGHAIVVVVVVVVCDRASVFTPKGVRSRYSVSTKEIPTF